MGFWNRFRRLERAHWHVCYECLRNHGNRSEEAIFFDDGPPRAEFMGRQHYPCPRCQSLNTRSFRVLKREDENALWGLERIVRSHPRERFQVKPPA